jgi:uncharacterized protein (TIGR00290 family)
MKVVSLWSGGKDSCFACYKAMSLGHEVVALINFTQTGSHTSLSHGLSAEVLLNQAESTGIPVIQKAMPHGSYRDEFKKLITGLKETKEIKGIVFGDIYLQEHKDWIDKVCGELEVEAILPLWGRETKELSLEIIDAGFKAVIVAVKLECMGSEWLGRQIDRQFVEEMKCLPQVDLCGEKGEYHTFVYDGPIFKKSVGFVIGEKVLRGKHFFLELIPEGGARSESREIEKRSFEIISEELDLSDVSKEHLPIVKRVIHATADFEFKKTLIFHADAIKTGIQAIRAGKDILTDIEMVKTGINKRLLGKWGGKVICNIPDRDQNSRQKTRAEMGIESTLKENSNIGILAIGNAPTALLKTIELLNLPNSRFAYLPILVVGVPVGFVKALESKALLATQKFPFITNLSRKGGTPVAVAIVNALLQIAEGGDEKIR